MATYPARWVLCGGWAVDAWLGGETREHGDIDVAVFVDDAQKLYEHLAGWQLVGHDATVVGDTNEMWTGRPLVLPAHLHCRNPRPGDGVPDRGILTAEQGFGLEIVFNELTEDGEWMLYFIPNDVQGFERTPTLSVPLEKCVKESRWDVPTLIPEVLLFYKATAYKGSHNYLRRRDHLDFERLLPRLSQPQRKWLGNAIAMVEADHPWLGVLSM
jgi:hypothetical protein